MSLLLNHKQLQSTFIYEIVVYSNIWKKVLKLTKYVLDSCLVVMIQLDRYMQNLIRRIAASVGLHLRRQRTGKRAGPRQILFSARTVARSVESRIACISYTLSSARTLACQCSLLAGIEKTEIASTTLFCRNYKLLILTCRWKYTKCPQLEN